MHCDDTNTCVSDGNPGEMGAPLDLGAGSCSPKCGGLTPICNGGGHCVACVRDTDCPTGSTCKVAGPAQANCSIGCVDDSHCGAGKKCCGGSCTDLTTDGNNCGACGSACTSAHAQVDCLAGKCTFAGKCDSGWGDCDNNPANGCEANLHVDPNNCTACGMKCAIANAINACADGCYEASCSFGFDDCNMDPKDGCETSVLSDGQNCGACGTSCAKLPHATAGCMNAGCVLGACEKGYADCNGDPKDGCESFVAGDKSNCGSCGNACPQNLPFCVSAVCSAVDPGVRYSASFQGNQSATPQQCNDWNTFRMNLKQGPYTKVSINGSNDMVGVECAGAQADQLCQALRNGGNTMVQCNGRSWGVGMCGTGIELSADGNICQCMSGYVARPCIGQGNSNWGGVNTVTCNAPTQTLNVVCQ